jgi:sortase A
MDVPSTHSKDVGWYKDGTIPGNKGSAVLAAHVVAAFKNLSKIKNGADIYVTTDQGSTLHFKVQRKQTYNLADLSPDTLFNLNDTQRLNLITCAGKSLGGGNYTKRFVAFAVLVE